MSVFNELLPKIDEICNIYTRNFNDDLEAAILSLDKFKEEYLNSRSQARDRTQNDKNHTTLQSINEDEDETAIAQIPSESTTDTAQRSKKRSKHEVEGMESPELEKRQKRKASVKAQSMITKHVNINLSDKLRQESSTQKRRRRKDDDKENEPEPIEQISVKQEKISIPAAEQVDNESAPDNVDIKQEVKEEIAMPPPAVPKSRKKAQRPEEASDEDAGGRRARNRKQADMAPLTATRSLRSSRARLTEQEDKEGPRRGRGRKAQETSAAAPEKDAAVATGAASPAEKPRPKRTRKAKKVSENQEIEKKTDNEADKETQQREAELVQKQSADDEMLSPVLQKIKPKATKKLDKGKIDVEPGEADGRATDDDTDKTKLTTPLNCTVTIAADMDRTVVLPRGVYDHAPVTPKAVCQMNETVVLEPNKEEKQKKIMNETVVLDKVSDKAENSPTTDSLLTDDESLEMATPPNKPLPEPTSAVKEKVQQFEELASRVTRTKTRAMAKKEEPTQSDVQTPPDRTKPVISTDTLTKMNGLIFNGKPPQISSSASKPRTNIPLRKAPSSASKVSVTREDEGREREDARRKKEALLEAKREMQRRKREEKMSAAAAARSAAESARRAALLAAERERRDRQLLADQGRQERLKEVEKKKLDQARKAAETEERRKIEEAARANRLQQEHKKMEEARRRQLEDEKALRMMKEAAHTQKEMERMHRELMERMKIKKKMEENRTPKKTFVMEPVYMQDGFQHLNSDEEEAPERPAPAWSASKNRRIQLAIQSLISQEHVDKLFSVREHTPDLREIFPNIERGRLKRTSSAVWRTPPRMMPTLKE